MIGVATEIKYKNTNPKDVHDQIGFKCDYYEYASNVYEMTNHRFILLKPTCTIDGDKGSFVGLS